MLAIEGPDARVCFNAVEAHCGYNLVMRRNWQWLLRGMVAVSLVLCLAACSCGCGVIGGQETFFGGTDLIRRGSEHKGDTCNSGPCGTDRKAPRGLPTSLGRGVIKPSAAGCLAAYGDGLRRYCYTLESRGLVGYSIRKPNGVIAIQSAGAFRSCNGIDWTVGNRVGGSPLAMAPARAKSRSPGLLRRLRI